MCVIIGELQFWAVNCLVSNSTFFTFLEIGLELVSLMLAIWVSCYLTYGGQLTGKRSNNGPICSPPAESHEMGVEGSKLVGGEGAIPLESLFGGDREAKAGAGAFYTCNVTPTHPPSLSS